MTFNLNTTDLSDASDGFIWGHKSHGKNTPDQKLPITEIYSVASANKSQSAFCLSMKMKTKLMELKSLTITVSWNPACLWSFILFPCENIPFQTNEVHCQLGLAPVWKNICLTAPFIESCLRMRSLSSAVICFWTLIWDLLLNICVFLECLYLWPNWEAVK